MTNNTTAQRLLTIAAAMLAALVVLKLVASTRWFDLYAVALVALAGALPLLATLMRGLERRGRSRWLALVAVVPGVVLALGQIGYWTMFFSSPKSGIALGLGRLMLTLNAGYAGPVVVAAVALAIAAVVWLATGAPIRRRAT